MHISLLFYCHNLAPKSIGNNIAHHYLRLVFGITILSKMSIGIGIANTFLGGLLVLLLPVLHKSIVNNPDGGAYARREWSVLQSRP